MSHLSLTFSIADQDFDRTKSIGILNVSLRLLEHLAKNPGVDRIAVLANSGLERLVPQDGKVVLHRHDGPNATRLRRIFWDQIQVYRVAKQLGNPWLFLPKGFASFLRKPPVRLITYVHDVIPQYYEEKYPEAVSPLERWYFRASLDSTLRHSTIVFTNSEFTKSEIARLAEVRGIPAPPIVAAGIGFCWTAGFEATRREDILVLSSRLPHKRTDLAMDYLSRWQQETGYSGAVHWIGPLPRNIQPSAFPNWRFHLRVPEVEYRSLMAGARVLVYFTEYEGFGMPPVEALAAGLCPVFSRVPATNEVMRGAGRSFENHSYSGFAQAMTEALTTPPDLIRQWTDLMRDAHDWRKVTDRMVAALAALELRWQKGAKPH